MRNHFAISIISLLMGSCISVQLPGGKTAPAKGVGWTAPPRPFKEFANDHSDKAWISESTGNTISYLSDCGNSNEPSLEEIESEALSSLNQVQRLGLEETSFNGRAARYSTQKGKIDGVDVQIALMVFKKNGCSYTLSYGGRTPHFEKEEAIFKKFLQHFGAP